eukprot:TRINITY_DN2669_c0_g1_i1.p1 TRINITY_DN2669_c0_g1~~TRINITY_DN2669_c0_g1_i1.p1  ORF type:complete len:194 (-),score=51.05 TRINITY_DN2669_c0_g1_i1:142-723(-)
MSAQVVDLYGGALRATIDKRFIDLSRFRDIPDHQEVYSDADADQSIIIEINEMLADASGDDIAKAHWLDLAEYNECKASEILEVSRIDSSEVAVLKDLAGDSLSSCFYIHGYQMISKFKEEQEAANKVDVQMIVIRLAHITTDINLIFNSPVEVSPQSSIAGKIIKPTIAMDKQYVLEVLNSLTVRDWSIFGQ